MVGLNTAVMIEADNIGFITPAGFVKIIIENLLQQNEPHFAGIGGKLQKNADNFNPLLKQSTAKGVIVHNVKPGGFLEAANIKNAGCHSFDKRQSNLTVMALSSARKAISDIKIFTMS